MKISNEGVIMALEVVIIPLLVLFVIADSSEPSRLLYFFGLVLVVGMVSFVA